MKGNPLVQCLVVFFLWGLLSVPIYKVTHRPSQSYNMNYHDENVKEKQPVQQLNAWISVKSVHQLNSISILHNRDAIIDENGISNHEFEQDIELIVDDNVIELHIKAIMQTQQRCVIEVVLTLDNGDELLRTIWGEDGLCEGVLEYKIQ